MKAYKKKTGVFIKPIKANRYGDYNFTTNVNSTLIGDTVLNGLNLICDVMITKKFEGMFERFGKNFIREVINGDGYLDISSSGVSLQISDESSKRRGVIKAVLNKLGLKAYEDGKLMIYCDVTGIDKRFDRLNLEILEDKNKRKLISSFAALKFFNLQMQRLEKLLNASEFDNKTVREIFGWSSNKTTKWLLAMVKKGYVSRIRKIGNEVYYILVKDKDIQRYLKWKKEYEKSFSVKLSSQIFQPGEQRRLNPNSLF
ncbi:hypothetical protein HZB88_03245 [archaeon]|nr:hypothetical protein [archaeon]